MSPMKIDAGWKLCQRKPSAAPAVSAASTPAASRSSESAITANVAAAIVHTPAARPSAPSVKFTTFITATIPTSVRTVPQFPSWSGSTKGSVMLVTFTPAATGIAAAPNWPASFTSGGSPPGRQSSSAPTSAMATAPARIPRVVRSSGRKSTPDTSTAARIASPPRPGTSWSWRSRSRGSLSTPSRRASRAVGGVATNAMPAATRNAQRASNSSMRSQPTRGPDRDMVRCVARAALLPGAQAA